MKLHVDLETLQLIQGPGQQGAIPTLRFKRGDTARLQVMFLKNGITPASIGDSELLEIQFGLKPRNQFDRAYFAHSSDWSMPADGDEAPTYVCAMSFNTVAINSALNVGSMTLEELPEITLMGEITWREGSGESTSSRSFLVVVENDINRGNEGVPSEADPAYPSPANIELKSNKGSANGYTPLDASGKVPVAHLPIGILIDPTIIALTGTGTNALAAIVTSTLPLNQVLGIVVGDTLSFYQLQTGTNATTTPGIIRPNDYHATTNARIWKQIL